MGQTEYPISNKEFRITKGVLRRRAGDDENITPGGARLIDYLLLRKEILHFVQNDKKRRRTGDG